MPWTGRSAKSKTKNATTPKLKHMWARVANSVLKQTGDEGRAVRIANSAVKKQKRKRR